MCLQLLMTSYSLGCTFTQIQFIDLVSLPFLLFFTILYFNCDVEEGKLEVQPPPSIDLRGAQPTNSVIILEIGAYRSHNSVVVGYF